MPDTTPAKAESSSIHPDVQNYINSLPQAVQGQALQLATQMHGPGVDPQTIIGQVQGLPDVQASIFAAASASQGNTSQAQSGFAQLSPDASSQPAQNTSEPILTVKTTQAATATELPAVEPVAAAATVFGANTAPADKQAEELVLAAVAAAQHQGANASAAVHVVTPEAPAAEQVAAASTASVTNTTKETPAAVPETSAAIPASETVTAKASIAKAPVINFDTGAEVPHEQASAFVARQQAADAAAGVVPEPSVHARPELLAKQPEPRPVTAQGIAAQERNGAVRDPAA